MSVDDGAIEQEMEESLSVMGEAEARDIQKEYEGKDVLLERERYASIEEFISEYEDYTPAEPLIKDETIRKAVRAWAEACDVEKCHYDGDGDFATRWHGIKLDGSQIELDEGSYTIAELCGEE